MLSRLRAVSAALVAVAALFIASTSQAAPGMWSVGGNFSTGLYSNSSLNDDLEAGGIEKVSSGWEYGGSIRRGLGTKTWLDVELNSINGKSSTSDSPNPDLEISTGAMAVPVNLYYTLSENDNSMFNMFVGAGPMFSSHWKAEQGSISSESESKTTFYGQAGLEAQYKVSTAFAFSARAMGRLAKASDLASKDDPSVTEDIDLSGASFGLGFRYSFGAK